MSKFRVWRWLSVVVALSFSGAVNAVECQYSVVDEWNSGFTASVTITNDSNETLNDWSVSWQYSDGSSIPNQPWNATLSGSDVYVANNANHNGRVAPGSSVSFGFNGSKGVAGRAAEIPNLGGVCSGQVTNQAPTSAFTLTRTSGKVPFNITFDGARSSDADGDQLTYLWDFGNGETSTDKSVTQTFTQVGTYTVSLTVSDGQSDPVVSVRTITAHQGDSEPAAANQEPIADFTLTRTSGRVPFDVAFNAARSSDPDGDTLTYLWDFGNGETSTSKSVTQTFTQAGTYTVSLTVYDGELTSEVSARTITANEGDNEPTNQAPVSAFTFTRTSGTVPFNVTFDGSRSSDADGDQLTYLWDFGNGETSTDKSVTQTFTQAGTYTVSLTVNDGQLDSERSVRTIVANGGVIEPTAYTLDASQSSLFFLSTKNTHNVETHHFDSLSGGITESGAATLVINLNSVETNVDLRNERVRSLLFETGLFSQATVALPVNIDQLNSMAEGTTELQTISGEVDLHGVNAVVSAEVAITRLTDSKVLVESVSPIIVEASTFNLTSGIDALRDVANLSVISYTVPVNFTLFFNAL